MESRSVAALAAAVLGALGLLDLLLGPGLARLGVVAPMVGFGIFLLGGLAGLLALLLGAVGLLRTRAGSGRSGRSQALFGLGAGALLLAILGLGAAAGAGVPRINDITTDPDDPPIFVAARREAGLGERDWRYPPDFAAQQRAAYPDIAPIEMELSPEQSFERSLRAAQHLGWEVVETRAREGRFEARHASLLFRFVDDVVVRVRPRPLGASVIDLRSKSRDGRSDLGANAARIRAFEELIR